MTEIIAINAPPNYSGLQIEQVIQINDPNLGRAIIIGLIIEYLLDPTYSFCKQFLKTKFMNLNMQESDHFNNLFSFTDINEFLGCCNRQDFYKFLGDFGQALIGNYYNSLDFIDVYELSKDLNIKLSLYEGTELVAEGNYFQFQNAPSVNIISEKATDQQYFFPYLFQRRYDTSQPFSFSESKIEEKKKSLNEFGWILAEIAEDVHLNKDFKNWLADLIKKYPSAQNSYSFLRRLKNAKMRTGKMPRLRTVNMNIAELKSSQSYIVKMPEFYQKFAPIPEESVLPEMRVKKKKPEPKVSEENAEEVKNAPANVPQASKPQTEVKSGTGDIGVHCEKCLNDPFAFDGLSCSCLLSNECIETSLQNQRCVNCKKPVSTEDFNRLQVYFS